MRSFLITGWIAIAIYFVPFALIHSILADPLVKSLARKRLGGIFERWSRLAFNLIALVMAAPFPYFLLILPDRVIYIAPWPWSGLLLAGQLIASVLFLASLYQTGVVEFLGISLPVESAPGMARRLVKDGFYGRVRNPLFLFGALFLWMSPIMTESLLVFNVMTSVYFYIGARHEERSLYEEFGHEYEEYKKHVPMFLPRL